MRTQSESTTEDKSAGTLGAVLYTSVVVGPPNRDGRTTTNITSKTGVERVFWKRGRWHVRLRQWTSTPLANVELHGDDKSKRVLHVKWSEENGGEEFFYVQKFNPVVTFNEALREVVVTVWEFPDAETEEEARVLRTAVEARVGFNLLLTVLSPASR